MLVLGIAKMKKKSRYKYSTEDLDIVDKEKGEAFRKKRLYWMECLNGEDPHSISRQIYSMLWDYGLFCTVNELRRIAVEGKQKGVGFNGPVIRLFDAGFVVTQSTGIRRLIEKPKKNPNWAVISLRSLIEDIKQNLDFITRENYVSYDGLPYDYESIKKKLNISAPKVGAVTTTGPDGWPMSERVHKSFDKLSQVDPKNRKRTDIIKNEVLERLELEVVKCEDIKKYVDKFIAHAAAPETRSDLTKEQQSLTLDSLKEALKITYTVASYLSGTILWESSLGGVPTPQFDHLKNLDKRWATEKALNTAREKWNDFANEVSTWDSTSF